jgi:hypothetical protein
MGSRSKTPASCGTRGGCDLFPNLWITWVPSSFPGRDPPACQKVAVSSSVGQLSTTLLQGSEQYVFPFRVTGTTPARM